MSERDLSDLLERVGERVAVGPAPLSSMVTGAARQRRRRTLGVTVSIAATVVATVGGAAILTTPGGADSSQPAVTSPESSAPSVPTDEGPAIPPGSRLIGIGHAAIAVPTEWGRNRLRCGTPGEDTVVIDLGVIPACMAPRPDGVESVSIEYGERPFDFRSDERLEVEGVPAERQETTCGPGGFSGGRVCRGTVYIPSLRVSFIAESSTSAGEVDRILEWIHIVPDRVGVPGYASIAARAQGGARAKYLEALEDAGLDAEIRTEKMPAVDPGYVLDVSPSPGTMVEPGEVVTVTVVGPPEGPADEVSVGVN